VLKWPDGGLQLPPLPQKIIRARALTGGTVRFDQTATGVAVRIDEGHADPVDTIIRLDLSTPIED